MSHPTHNQQQSGASSYPDKTTGSEAAAAFRKQANNWSEQTRAELFEQGMQLIYGGQNRAQTKVRP